MRRRGGAIQGMTLLGLAMVFAMPWLQDANSRQPPGDDACTETQFALGVVEYELGATLPLGGAPSARPVDGFTYLVSPDDVGQPTDRDVMQRPSLHVLESTESTIVASGVAAAGSERAMISLCPGRYLVSVDAPGHSAWGEHVRVTSDGAQGRYDASPRDVVTVALTSDSSALVTLVAHAYEDARPTNGKPDPSEQARADGATRLSGFVVRVRDAGGALVERDAWGNPVCARYETEPDGSLELGADGRPVYVAGTGGACVTGSDGVARIGQLEPGGYVLELAGPDGSRCAEPPLGGSCPEAGRWVPTGVIDPERPGRALATDALAPRADLDWWFGFVRATGSTAPAGVGNSGSDTGRVTGCVRTHVGYPPFAGPVVDSREPITDGWIALNDVRGLEATAVLAVPLLDDRDCPGGLVDLRRVPEGSYRAFLWDVGLEYVPREIELPRIRNGARIELPDDDPRAGAASTALFRRYGWVSGYVFQDDGRTAGGRALGRGVGNGVRDCLGPRLDSGLAADPTTCERPLAGVRLRMRARDGSVVDSTVTRPDGFYTFTSAVSELERFELLEIAPQDASSTGASLHDPYDWSSVGRLASVAGHNLQLSQLTAAGHRTWVDWGLQPSPPKRPAGIHGVVLYDAARAAADPGGEASQAFEPGVPDVQVRLWNVVEGADTCNGPKTGAPGCDDQLANVYAGTDHWVQPNRGTTDPNGPCEILDPVGNPVVSPLPPSIPQTGGDLGELCVEVPMLGSETKDGTYDGRYSFTEVCSRGYSEIAHACAGGGTRGPLTPGQYVVEAVVSEPWQVVREEDVNVVAGGSRSTASDSARCVGSLHTVDVAGSGADGYPRAGSTPASVPVANAVLARAGGSPYEGKARPLCDKRLVGLEQGDSAAVDFFVFPLVGMAAAARPAQLPARVLGRLGDATAPESDERSIMFGAPRPLAGVPIGIRDRNYRLLTTIVSDELGYYEALLPAGVDCGWSASCASTYTLVVNDPGPEEHALKGLVGVSAGARTVRGLGTAFLDEVDVGDRIRVGQEVEVVADVVSDTLLTVNPSWRATASRLRASVVVPGQGFDPTVRVQRLTIAAQSGGTTFLDTAVGRVTTGVCLDESGPELYAVHHDLTVARARPDSGPAFTVGQARALVLLGRGFGKSRGKVALVSASGRRRTLEVDRWSDGEIRLEIPASVSPGPYQLLVSTAPAGGPTVLVAQDERTVDAGITIHLLGKGYAPVVRFVDGRIGSDANAGTTPAGGGPSGPFRTIQRAIDALPRRLGDTAPIVVVAPGDYRENVVLSRRVKLQGFGPATGPAGDERENAADAVAGTTLDGRVGFDWSSRAAWSEVVAAVVGGSAALDVPRGAGITVIAHGDDLVPPDVATALGRARGRSQIDGFAIRNWVGAGAGGVLAYSDASWLKVSNDVFEGNQGALGGAIVVGSPSGHAMDNRDLVIVYNRIVGNAGSRAGGIALFGGSSGYTVSHNLLCSNVSDEGGGGLAHIGRSTGTAKHPANTVADNRFVSNSSTAGGGAMLVTGIDSMRAGSSLEGVGPVDVLRTRFAANTAGADGGGLLVRATRPGTRGACGPSRDGVCRDRVRIVNDAFVNNNAARAGGGIHLAGALNVELVNSTVAHNTTTASCYACDPAVPHGAGLTTEASSVEIRALLPPDAPAHSNPVLLNDLFFGNEALTIDRTWLLDPSAHSHGTVDLDVIDGDGYLCLASSAVSSPYAVPAGICPDVANGDVVLDPDGDPFVDSSAGELDLRIDSLQLVAVHVVGVEEAAGNGGQGGDYHLCDPIVLRLQYGRRCSSQHLIDGGLPSATVVRPWGAVSVAAPTNDIDGSARSPKPSSRSLGSNGAPDIGADELEVRSTTHARRHDVRLGRPQHPSRGSPEKPPPESDLPVSGPEPPSPLQEPLPMDPPADPSASLEPSGGDDTGLSYPPRAI